MRHGVYVLALQHGGLYVGRSNDIDKRIQQHCEGSGSAWCRHQGGVVREVATVHVGSSSDLASWEMNETVAQMLMHGFENVRGWEFTNCAALTSKECDTIKTIVMGQGNMCRRCGGEGHFATHCHEPIHLWLQDIEKLQALSQTVPAPVQNVIAQAAMAYQSRQPAVGSSAGDTATAETLRESRSVRQRVVCTRCGRDSHMASSCFAHKHFTGSELKPHNMRPQ
jgi:ribosomal protein L37E